MGSEEDDLFKKLAELDQVQANAVDSAEQWLIPINALSTHPADRPINNPILIQLATFCAGNVMVQLQKRILERQTGGEDLRRGPDSGS